MDEQDLRQYLLTKPEATVSQPFGVGVDVFKVQGKMFATLACRNTPQWGTCWHMNLKCEPNEALILRDIFSAVVPGYHMNKKHWNSVVIDDSIPEGELQRMMDNSYLLVLDSFSAKVKASLISLLNTERGSL